MRRWIGWSAVALSGCSLTADVSVATKAVDAFHRQLNAGQFVAIYAATSPAFKASTTEPQFEALLDAVHRKLGAFQSDTATGWNVNATTGGTFAALTFTSSYTGGQAQEQFTYRLAGGRAALASYQINAPALIIR